MKTTYIKQALLTLLCIAATACTNEDYQLYDTTQKDSAFMEYINDNDEVATSVTYRSDLNFSFPCTFSQ